MLKRGFNLFRLLLILVSISFSITPLDSKCIYSKNNLIISNLNKQGRKLT